VALSPDLAGVVEIPGPWQHRYVAANGARFHVAESVPDPASGAPLVLLLHGFPEFWWSWRTQLPLLAEHGFRAVAMDLRGYGGSDKPPRGYDPVTLADDVAGVVKALGERRAIVVGHGWGGYVGWAAAALHPRQVAGLCAVSAPHPLTMLSQLGRATFQRRQSAGALGHVLAMQAPFFPERRLSRAASGYVAKHLRAWSSPESSFPDTETAQRYHDAFSLWPASHCALEYHRWLVRSRVRPDGRRFNTLMEPPVTPPVCMVHGTDDPAVPVQGVDRSRRYVGGAYECHTLPGTGHFPHEEDPEAFDAVLLAWLERLGED
jgi:pimeloyl-ACP methyl ester carboxylesterase